MLLSYCDTTEQLADPCPDILYTDIIQELPQDSLVCSVIN